MSESAASPLRQLLRAIWPDNQSVSPLPTPGHKSPMATLEPQRTRSTIRANPTAVYTGNPFQHQTEARTQSPPVPGSVSSVTSAITTVNSPTVLSPRPRTPKSIKFSQDCGSSRLKSDSTNNFEDIQGPIGVCMNRGQLLRQRYNLCRMNDLQRKRSESAEDDSPLVIGRSTASTPSTPSVTKVKTVSSASRDSDSPVVQCNKEMPSSRSCPPAQSKKGKKANLPSSEAVIKTRNGSEVDFSSKVTHGDPMLQLNLAFNCPLPPGLVSDSTPLSRKFNPEVYRIYGVPDPRMSPEDRLRQFQRVSLSPRIKSDFMPKEMKVYVAVRMRPYTMREKKDWRNREQCILFDKKLNTVNVLNNSTSFEFDSLFDSSHQDAPNYAQERVYKSIGEPLVRHALEGYNSCLFAYGQTGSGKTYSIAGDTDCKGIIPRLVEDLFYRIPHDTCVSFTYIEIYNDNIHNLLADSTTEMQNISYKIREHSVDGPYIPKLVPIVAENPQDLLSRWSMGNLRRQTAATTCNSRSSRSHAILQITIKQRYFEDSDETDDETLSEASDGERLTSKINIVDLAGSERSNVSLGGDRLREGGYINKSLFTLGKVITELSNRKSNTRNHIPYRDSPLTFLLKESLGGNSRTIMLATISPSADCVDETLSTLRYAAKAKRIVNTVRVNDDPKLVRIRLLEGENARLLAILAKLKIDPNSFDVTRSLESNSSVELSQSPVISPYDSPTQPGIPPPAIKQADKATSPLKAYLKQEGTDPIINVSAQSTWDVQPFKSTFLHELKKIAEDALYPGPCFTHTGRSADDIWQCRQNAPAIADDWVKDEPIQTTSASGAGWQNEKLDKPADDWGNDEPKQSASTGGDWATSEPEKANDWAVAEPQQSTSAANDWASSEPAKPSGIANDWASSEPAKPSGIANDWGSSEPAKPSGIANDWGSSEPAKPSGIANDWGSMDPAEPESSGNDWRTSQIANDWGSSEPAKDSATADDWGASSEPAKPAETCDAWGDENSKPSSSSNTKSAATARDDNQKASGNGKKTKKDQKNNKKAPAGKKPEPKPQPAPAPAPAPADNEW